MTHDASRSQVVGAVRKHVLAHAVTMIDGDEFEQSLLIDDLGLDSLKFVKVIVGLERELGLDEFPVQEWVDSCLESRRALDVRALIEACCTLLEGGDACSIH